MISYRPFWKTLKKSTESTYTLIYKHGISSATVDKLRKNKPITTTTLNDLCTLLECRVEEIAEYIPDETDRKYK
ncbi:MAG: helix-turn-helix transcriptional regulator [Firmicutes bacterium]|nr:helix-turn-helix transcriptional regulator [Bacillota bacterium]